MSVINYISGHLDVSPEEFREHYKPAMDQALERQEGFVVGDAPGTDTLAQKYLQDKTEKVTVYHMFASQRNLERRRKL